MTTDERLDRIKDEILEEIRDTNKNVREIHNKLFVGNSQPPITVQIDRLNSFKKVSYWFFGALTVASFGLVVRLVYSLITGKGV